MNKQVFLVLAQFAASSLIGPVSFAGPLISSGGTHAPMIKEYSCFNRAELADAPHVSIATNTAHTFRSIWEQVRGTTYEYDLNLISSDEISSEYTDSRNAISVTVKNDGSNEASVTLMGLDLTYQCNQLNQEEK